MTKVDEGVETKVETDVETDPPAPVEEVKIEVQDASTERDYRKELEEEQAKLAKVEKERDNYRTATLIAKRKARKEKENIGDDDDDDYGDGDDGTDGDIDSQADEIANRVLEKIAPTLSQNVVDSEIGNYTNDPDKNSLIKFHYDNSVVKTGFDAGSIRSDIQKAIAIADAPRLRIERDEAARASLAKNTPSLSGAGHSSEVEVERHSYGWTPEQIKDINSRHQLSIGRDMTEQELVRAWEMSKSGTAGSELPPVK